MRRAGFSLVVRALFLAAALLARASADDVVADTPEATPPATPSPEAQEQAVAQINEALAPYQPEAGLTPEQIVECQHRLAAAVDSINQGQQASASITPVTLEEVQQFYSIYAPIYTREYCGATLGLLESIAGGNTVVQENMAANIAANAAAQIPPTEEAPIPSPPTDAAPVDAPPSDAAPTDAPAEEVATAVLVEDGEAGGEGEPTRRRRRLQTTFQGVADPTLNRFTPGTLGQGYTDFSTAAAPYCQRYSPNACSADSVGSYLIGWETAKVAKLASELALAIAEDLLDANCIIPLNFICPGFVLAKNIAAGVNLGVTIALVAIEGVKESIDYVWDTLQDERQNDMWDNMKIILSNQALELQKAEDTVAAVIESSDILTAATKNIITITTTILDRIDAIDTQILKLGNSVANQLTKLGGQLLNLVDNLGNAVTTTLSNSEIRMTNTIINAVYDKFSIGGIFRPGRLPVPPAVDGTIAPQPNVTARRLLAHEEEQAVMKEEVEEVVAHEHPGKKFAHPRELQITTRNLTWLWGYGCDSNDNDNNGNVDGLDEDKISPILRLNDVYAASINRWFTNNTVLTTFVRRTTVAVDDCGTATLSSNAVLSGQCKAATVTVTASDRSNNNVTETVAVWYDPSPPSVSFSLKPAAAVLEKGSTTAIKAWYRFVDLNVTGLVITDNCDPQPYVQVNVYSDEQELVSTKPVQAVVARRLNATGAIIGWRVQVFAATALVCKDSWILCDVPDGRVYTVQICAKDEAGLQTCAQQSIGVSRGFDKPAPVSQGNVFLVAHDAAYLNRVPADNTESFSPNNFAIYS